MCKKVMIVEDEILVANDIRNILSSHGFEVTGIANNYEKAISLFTENTPDIIICDVNLNSEKTGIDIIETIQKIKEVLVIYITAYTDKKLTDAALSTNPDSFLLKPFSDLQLIIAIKRVLKTLDQHYNVNGNHNGTEYTPTKRELQIIKLIAQGYTTSEIAKELSISFETVQSHRKNILRKFKLNNSAGLVSKAIDNKWIS